MIEIVLDRPFAAAGYEDEVLNARLPGFLYRIVDQRAVNDGQHLFGDGFGRREKTASQTSHGKHNFSYLVRHRSGPRITSAPTGTFIGPAAQGGPERL